ncbi:MltR family transcriptional regulator [Serratia sp. UGAL515B_01]|uniref:MltR family transcriptional regulator n=1 Tax=Serratia sp. UGAL515B_01 TaxID=2986763 RepID=UPI0029558FB5|nr:MltR family transcriptional regulator [Serratia sp. UGAL515B_01]WON75931.1 MltR family transcriptional regulator [Serratia sp. UGAL515B_01]
MGNAEAMNNEEFGSLNRLTSYLDSLDERGLILSLSAFSEDSLRIILSNFMLDNKASKQLLEGFNSPLGTFSSRIKACYSLGLITEKQYSDLEILRKIRNKFSHTWEKVSFSDKDISQQISKLNYSSLNFEFPDSELKKVRTSISSLLIELRVISSQIVKKNQKVKLIGTHLVSGFSTRDYTSQIEHIWKSIEDIKKDLLSDNSELRKFTLHKARELCNRRVLVNFSDESSESFNNELLESIKIKQEIESIIEQAEFIEKNKDRAK